MHCHSMTSQCHCEIDVTPSNEPAVVFARNIIFPILVLDLAELDELD